MRTDAPSLIERNPRLHPCWFYGVTVEYRRPDGSIAASRPASSTSDAPHNNDWLAVNQFTVARASTPAGRTWYCSSTASIVVIELKTR